MRKFTTILTAFTITLFSGIVLAQPANNDCINAVELTNLDNGCVTTNNAGATYDTYTGACMSYANNIWFYFTAQGNSIDITVNGVNRPEYFLSYAPAGGDPCNIAEAVGLQCVSGTGNWNTISSTYNNLVPGETYYIQIANNTGGGGGSGNIQLCVNNPISTSVGFCEAIEPFCSDSPVTFPAATGTTSPAGPAYGCLFTRPNPAWFYLEIADAGDIQVTLSPSPARDIDYILWGPFNNVAEGCEGGISSSGNIEDCSYVGGTAPEIVDIANAQTGDIYILLITNYSNLATNVTVTQTGGTGSTNCAILLPIVLSRFEVVTKNNEFNLISWQTLSEQNNDYFTLEHSKDGFIWNIIDRQKGAGTTSSTNDYSFNHKDFSNGINYYRLTQTDFDGEFETFNIISVENKLNLKLIKTLNMYGQIVNENYKGLVIEYYSDGSTIKVIR